MGLDWTDGPDVLVLMLTSLRITLMRSDARMRKRDRQIPVEECRLLIALPRHHVYATWSFPLVQLHARPDLVTTTENGKSRSPLDTMQRLANARHNAGDEGSGRSQQRVPP